MENLNNLNTWDELRVQFPSATRILSIFIEQRRGALQWTRTFNPKYFSVHVSGHAETRITNDSHPKFEDLPFDLQVGVLIAFLRDNELLSTKLGKACESIQLFKIHLHDRLGMLEEILNRKIDW